MNLSKSKYTNAFVCKKMLWLDTYKKEEKGEVARESVLDNGNMVHDVARNILGEHTTISFNEDLRVMVEETKRELEKDKVVICEASFSYQNNFCSVDLLEKENDEYSLYEVKGSTGKKDIFLTDISYQYYVLKQLGLNVKKCFLVYLNNKYYRKLDLDLNQLFIKEDVTDEIIKRSADVKNNIKDINAYLNIKEEREEKIDLKCFSPYPCPFFNYCTKSLEKPNVFDISGMRTKEKINFYQNKKISFKELLNEKMNPKYKQQIEFEIYDKDSYINKNKIKEFLDTLTYPLYFLDFETFQLPIPKYENTNPYMQIPFQYSLHYLKNNKLYHKEFLGNGGDPRRELAERLIRDIPLNVTTLAYNMSFEKGVIKNLAYLYPDLSDHLMNIYENIKDLMIPFYNRDFYCRSMKGSYSIKKVLPALFPNDPKLDYHNLDLVHNGSEAMSYYDTLYERDIREQEHIRERLLRYCELDTYAMVKIYEKLLEVIEEK